MRNKLVGMERLGASQRRRADRGDVCQQPGQRLSYDDTHSILQNHSVRSLDRVRACGYLLVNAILHALEEAIRAYIGVVGRPQQRRSPQQPGIAYAALANWGRATSLPEGSGHRSRSPGSRNQSGRYAPPPPP